MKTRKIPYVHFYPPFEEKLNVWTHFFGLIMSIVALVLLIFRAIELENLFAMISFPIFGLSMILLYLASTLFHSAKKPRLRFRLNIFDHAAIYVLIAGSYSPFLLVSLEGSEGFRMFFVVWMIAVVGVVFKMFFLGKWNVISTILYVGMGWLIIFSFKSLMINLDYKGLVWLISGGVSYTFGAILYSFNKIKFNHAIFHVFVLFGTFCHFMSVYFYVIPISKG